MTVTLTSPAEGKQPGDTYTGPNEAYLVASGYARKNAGPFTGPGLDNVGPADTTLANNREFTPTTHQIAGNGGTPEKGTNEGDLELHDADAPYKSQTGDAFGDADETAFTGFANDPAARPVEFGSIRPATGPAAGGTVVTVSGFGLDEVTSVTFDGVAGTSLVHDGRQTLTVHTPVGTAGPADIVLVTPGDDVTKAAGFTYTA